MMAACGSMATTAAAVSFLVTETARKGCVWPRMSTTFEQCIAVPFVIHFVERDDREGFTTCQIQNIVVFIPVRPLTGRQFPR